MAAEHIYGLDAAFIYLVCPGDKGVGLCAVDGVDEEAGKEKVVGHEAFVRNLFVDLRTIRIVYLG